MRFQTVSILTAASLASALTPQGFVPGSQSQLFVQYGNQAALNGAVALRDSTQVQPTLATSQRLQGTYAVLMVDLDIPTDTPGQTNTLLHWLQTGLTSSTQATTFNTTGGTSNGGQVFLLQNRGNAAPLAEYIGPNPPAREPLSHRYTFILVDHSTITQQGLNALSAAAQTRIGFNALDVLTQAGLASRVVAGNFFNVTNPGPVGADNGSGQANPTDGSQQPSDSNTFTQPAASGNVQAAGIVTVPRVGVASLCVGLVSALLWAL
ncbi:hypothetical protein jhhlp_002614 [Lomentospora prolificans]|uniref:Phosphatidylethanolamine-binding protein n=1 Tax=Lomentospora prolificans TaxID=41688 RepID=A0A2N3NEN9_9PEZI|nr:hypothetical protein jhhlp_002614 [Lomentospora prolificans]